MQCGACLRTPPPLDACLAAVPYTFPWGHLITRYKFGGAPGWSATFALLLRSTPWVEPALEQCDLLLPMPLSRQRLQERGFNQALELARHLAPAKVATDLLLRIRHTPAQSSLRRDERLHNVRGAFAVDPLRSEALRDKRVVLLDDVMTSGASLFAAAQVLRQAGAAHITGLVLARTAPD
jgi:ComF family protein